MPLIMNGVTIPTNVANVLNYNGTNITSVIFNGTNVWTQSLNFTANLIISAHTTYYNIRTALINAGWNQVTPVVATVTVNSGVYVYATSTGAYAMETGSLPSGSSLTIVNNGYIIGKGGNGGGGSGGPALNINYPCSITNNSYIAGGGGGGANTYGGGGAGGGAGGGGASGGGPGASGSNGGTLFWVNGKTNVYRSYGAGGGRILPGSGGQGSRGFFTNAYGGGAGGGGGAEPDAYHDTYGGNGGSANNGGGTSPLQQNQSHSGGGGGWGASGGGASYGTSPGSGGKAVNLNGNAVTWVATGNRYGTIS